MTLEKLHNLARYSGTRFNDFYRKITCNEIPQDKTKTMVPHSFLV